MRSAPCRILGPVLLAAMAMVPAAHAQVASTGNIYGSVRDESGAVLPGAVVDLTGEAGTRSTTTGSQGDFRFVNVDHGAYDVKVNLTGFSSAGRQVVVRVGQNVDLAVTLKVASVAETVTVSADAGVIDAKRPGTATTISKEELSQIPTSRDPWALMRTVPGVLVDRVNVAGSESGQQSNVFAKGADAKDTVWSLDGVIITDMAAIGASPTYYTFDTFDEVNFTTGGNDVRLPTGGLGIALVTKRGTNSFHGSAGINFAHDKLQWSNLPDELGGDARLRGNDKADHTDQINDYAFDLGGPIVKDKLWFYGSYGKNDIRIVRLNQTADKTLLKNYSAKVNWQATDSDMVSGFWFFGAKEKIGRAGAAPVSQALEGTLWNQGDATSDGPPGFSKLEWNHIFGPSFFANVKAAYYNQGFTLAPQGGLDGQFIVDNIRSESRGTSNDLSFLRPQYSINGEASYFANAWGGNHEIRFGGGWRRVDSTSLNTYPGGGVQVRYNPTSTRVRLYRAQNAKSQIRQTSFFVSDTFSRDRLTLNLGLRFDRQVGTDVASMVEGSGFIPNLLPTIDYAGGAGRVEWNDFSPRVGFTYALDDSRNTLLRASFARYAGQISSGDAGWRNPLVLSFLEYDWTDRNGDGLFQEGEADLDNLRNFAGVDPNNPSAAESPNEIDPDFHANKDTEIVAGIERQLAANLAVSAAYTFRKSTDLTATQLLSGYYWYSWVGVTSADYTQGAPVTRNGFTATPWILNDGVLDRISGALLLRNRPDFSRTYNGLELAMVKRMSNRWMARAAVSLNDWKENVGPAAVINPTHYDLDPQIDGGQHMEFAVGSGKNYYTSAKWQVNVNGMYQLPGGFEIAANLFGRQGYPKPVYLQLDTGALDGTLNVLAVGDTDDIRLKSLWDLDVRLAKNIRLGGANITLAGEVFNVLNANTELYRNPSATSATLNRLDEILAPRIARLSARLTF
ncbi:MAG TPA: TonB-dependent receptor [Vicinamibacteria bacterium]|nr:TonB-dependent receptor [Vicinamibacteria bacterium]